MMHAPKARKPPVIVSLFNHKGGVSKTTTTFNLGWAMAMSGKRVLIVDGDPQCNLTGTALNFAGRNDFEEFYQRVPNANLFATLQPAFTGRPEGIRPATIEPTGQAGLSILAGHIDLAEYEAQLAVAFSTGVALPALSNLPGALGMLLRMTADAHGIDIVLVDMSPSIGALNQSLFLASDYFIVPTSPDYFCYLAINSLARVLPRWNASVGHLRGTRPGLAYPLPANGPKFMGILSQRYRPRSGAPAVSFQSWIERIKVETLESLVPALAAQNMVVSESAFIASGAADTPYNLANIADFNSLIAISHECSTPVFALTDEQINRTGRVLHTMTASRNLFEGVFVNLANTISALAGL